MSATLGGGLQPRSPTVPDEFSDSPAKVLDLSFMPGGDLQLRFDSFIDTLPNGKYGLKVGDEYFEFTADGTTQVFRLGTADQVARLTAEFGAVLPVRLGAPDVTAPSLESATVNRATLVLEFDEALGARAPPAASAFEVTVAGTAQVPNAVSVEGAAVTLTLADPAVSGDAVSVAYTKPASNALADAAGNETASFTTGTGGVAAVTNDTGDGPFIGISADHASLPLALTAPGGKLTFTVERTGSTANALAVTVTLAQEQPWLAAARLSQTVTIPAGSSSVDVALDRSWFWEDNSDTLATGRLTATVEAVAGYDTSAASTSVHIQGRQRVVGRISLGQALYEWDEDDTGASFEVVTRLEPGVTPSALARVAVAVSTGTDVAASPGDYTAVSRTVVTEPADYALEDGVWVARKDVAVTLVDDAIPEGEEQFFLKLEKTAGFNTTALRLCYEGLCGEVGLTDDYRARIRASDVPAGMQAVSSADYLLETDNVATTAENESQATVTLSFTSAAFATDMTATVTFTGSAAYGEDYTVSPADADDGVDGHQIVFAAGATAVSFHVNAIDDSVDDPGESLALTAALASAGNAPLPFGSLNLGVFRTEAERTGFPLTALEIAPGEMTPPFAASVTSYTVDVETSVTRLTVTPTKGDPNATVSYRLEEATIADASSDAGFQVDLPEGDGRVELEVLVTSADSSVTTNYVILVQREFAPSPVLTALTVDRFGEAFDFDLREFDSLTRHYYLSVANSVDNISLHATPELSGSLVEFFDDAGNPRVDQSVGVEGHRVNLAVGRNVIEIKVTNPGGTRSETYTVYVGRAAAAPDADDCGLVWCANLTLGRDVNGKPGYVTTFLSASGTLSPPSFEHQSETYGPTEIIIEAERLTVTFERRLPVGSYLLRIGGEDIPFSSSIGMAGEWTINLAAADQLRYVSRAFGDVVPIQILDADTAVTTLSALSVSDGTNALSFDHPAFSADTTTYYLSVDNSVDRIAVSATPTNSGASVEVRDGTGAKVTGRVALAEGANLVRVVVTAEDTVNRQDYLIHVAREASAPDPDDCVVYWCANMTVGVSKGGTVFGWSRGVLKNVIQLFGGLAPDRFHFGLLEFYVSDLVFGSDNNNLTFNLDSLGHSTHFQSGDYALIIGSESFEFRASGSTNSFTIPGAADKIARLLDSHGEFGEVVGVSLALDVVPGAPRGLAATADGPDSNDIQLSWTAPADNGGEPPTGYRIEWSADGNAPWTTLEESYSGTTYTQSGLAAGTQRFYRVSAINAKGAGAVTPSAFATAGESDLWNAVLIPSRENSNALGCLDCVESFEELSETTVRRGARLTYTVEDLYENTPDSTGPARVVITFSDGENEDPNLWTLHIDGHTELAFADALVTNIGKTFSWTNVDVAWTSGEPVVLKITNSNDPAQGAPRIIGDPERGALLRSDTGEIGDLNDFTDLPIRITRDYEFEWLRVDGANETAISGANGGTYVLTADDVGKRIRLRVSWTDYDGYAESAASELFPSSGTITDIPATRQEKTIWTSTLTPVGFDETFIGCTFCDTDMTDDDFIHGTTLYIIDEFAEDQVSDADPATLYMEFTTDVPDVAYTWFLHVGDALVLPFRSADSITNKRASWNQVPVNFVLDEDVDLKIVARNADPTGRPEIGGIARAGETLTSSVAAIDDRNGLSDPNYRYRWIRVDDGGNEGVIHVTTSGTYTLTELDVGKQVKVEALFTDDNGFEESRKSAAYPPNLTVAAVDEFAFAEQELWSATLNPSGAEASYGCFFITCKISDALSEDQFKYPVGTSSTLRIVELSTAGAQADMSERGVIMFILFDSAVQDSEIAHWHLQVDGEHELAFADAIGAADNDYKSRGWTNAPFAFEDGTPVRLRIVARNAAATGAPVIAGGPPRTGQTLSASPGDIADGNGLKGLAGDMPLRAPPYAYQWLRVEGANETLITGAVSSEYTLADADVGARVRVRVSFTDDAGFSESRSSAVWPAGGSVTDAANPPQDRELWSATLDPEASDGWIGCLFCNGRPNVLDDDSFEYDSATYTVTRVGENQVNTADPAVVGIRFSSFLPDGSRNWHLHIDGATELAFADATVAKGDGMDTYEERRWPDIPVSFTVGTEVGLKITVRNLPATGAPTVTGTDRVGETLTAAPGDIADGNGLRDPPDYKYQWVRVQGANETDISGATESEYTLTPADAGKLIKVRVSFTDQDEFEEARASDVFPSEGAVRTADDSTPGEPRRRMLWSATMNPLVYGAKRGCLECENPKYLTEDEFDHLGKTWTIDEIINLAASVPGHVTHVYMKFNTPLPAASRNWTWHYHNSVRSFGEAIVQDDGKTRRWNESANFNYDDPVDMALYVNNVPPTGAPHITGRAQEGAVLKARTGRVEDDNGLTNPGWRFQWVRLDGGGVETDIPGATGEEYELTGEDAGMQIILRASFTDDDGFAETRSGEPYPSGDAVAGLVNKPATGRPSIFGKAVVGATLTASTANIGDGDGLGDPGWTFEWVRLDGGSGTVIAGATSRTYTATAADAGYQLRARAIFTDDAGNAERSTSAPFPESGTVAAAVTQSCEAPGEALWSAQLTVARAGFGGDFFRGYRLDPDYGSLSDDSFDFRTAGIEVQRIDYEDVAGGELVFEIGLDSGTAPADGLLGRNGFTLQLGSTCFAIPDPGDGKRFAFAGHGLNWSDGDTVAARLTRSAGGAAAAGVKSARTTGQYLTLEFDKPLRRNPVPSSAFRLTVDGEEVPSSAFQARLPNIAGRVTLYQRSARYWPESGQSVRLSYQDRTPGDDANVLQGKDGVDLSSFYDLEVTNESTLPLSPLRPFNVKYRQLASYLAGIIVNWDVRNNPGKNVAWFEVQWSDDGGATWPSDAEAPFCEASDEPYVADGYDGQVLCPGRHWGGKYYAVSEFRHRGLCNGNTYVYRVRAVFNGRVSAWTTSAEGKTIKLKQNSASSLDFTEGSETNPCTYRGLVGSLSPPEGGDAEPLTVSVESQPERHDGGEAFEVRIAFDEALADGFSYSTLEEHAFTASGGEVTGARRVVSGENRRWDIEVVPSGDDHVTLVLGAGPACGEEHAMCTAGGRRLAENFVLTVPGPATAEPLTVAVESQPEGHDGGEAFEVRIAFDEALADNFSYSTLKDHAFTVSGGEVTAARRVVSGENRRWDIEIAPSGFEDVTLELGAGPACGEAHAMCTAGGRRLAESFVVTVPGPPKLEAEFADWPNEGHDGASEFEVQIAFSEPIFNSFSYVDDAVTATGGSVESAKRVDGASDRWRLLVTPDGKDAVTLTLNGGGKCTDRESAVLCTEDLRVLSNSPSITVKGPIAISVADAEATEGPNATMDFTVSLSRNAILPVTVEYATESGTATSGEDFTATSGTLTFTVAQSSKTVSVPVQDDSHDDNGETFLLKLSNASGGYIEDGEATGTIKNSDPIPQAWIARFGRTVADQVLDAVDGRLRASRTAGAEIGLAGQRIGLGTLFNEETGKGAAAGGAKKGADGSRPTGTAVEDAGEKARLEALTAWLNGEDPEEEAEALQTRSMTAREVLMGSSFSLAGQTKGGGFAELWGRIAQSRFSGREGALSLDGDVTTGLLGVDHAWDRWTMGLLVSRSTGTGGYRGESSGEIEASATAVTPWAGYTASERVSVWGAAGYGEGELTVKPDKQAAMKTDLSMKLAAGGLRATLAGGDGPRLEAVTGARWVRTTSARLSSAAGNLGAATADVWRLTLGLDGSWPLALGESGTMTPRLALGLRHDGGDAETGYGIDIAGAVDMAVPGEGLTASLSGRGVLTHEAAGLTDRGIAGTLAWKPGSGERGPSLSLSQTFGTGAASGKDALLSRETLEGLAANDNGSGSGAGGDELKQRRLETRFGYGYGMFGDRFTATSEVGLDLTGTSRETVLGWRLAEEVRSGLASGLNVEVARQESAGGVAGHRLGFGWRLAEEVRSGLAFGLDGEAGRRESAGGAVEHRLGLGFGWRLEGAGDGRFEVRFEGSRVEPANDPGSGSGAGAEPVHTVGLRVTARW